MITQSRNTIAVPPGETIKEQLEDRNMTQRELASRTGYSEKHISQLINGQATLSVDAALKLECVFGVPSSFWSGLEADYRADLARVEQENDMEAEETLARKSPYAQCVKLGWLPPAANAKEKVRCLREFFCVSSLQFVLLPEKNLLPKIAYRCMDAQECHEMARAIWAQQAKKKAESVHVERLDLYKLEQMIPAFRAMTNEPPNEFHPKLKEMCASCGVALVLIPHLEGSGIQGASFATNFGVALALTARGKWADRFWFDFFHELCHILEMHFSQAEVDTDEQNEAADAFARNTLIPQHEYDKLSYLPLTAESIRAFAQSVGIAPGIVVGRLQKEGLLEYDHMNSLKIKYELKKRAA